MPAGVDAVDTDGHHTSACAHLCYCESTEDVLAPNGCPAEEDEEGHYMSASRLGLIQMQTPEFMPGDQTWQPCNTKPI
jgi:hypothetical protein